jgi:hypothetical protein
VAEPILRSTTLPTGGAGLQLGAARPALRLHQEGSEHRGRIREVGGSAPTGIIASPRHRQQRARRSGSLLCP